MITFKISNDQLHHAGILCWNCGHAHKKTTEDCPKCKSPV